MAYQSLYRRYRPGRFSDLRGQEHIVRALRNAVRDEKVGHAYLFTGPRGTGKTSTARILAKALNCDNLQNGEPDGTCESCLAIDAGTSYDVQELDAASNNGVADVRDLIGRVNLGSPGRTKVYILDEVHMLTAQASAALLKTLEEPPPHVVFVLATTDPQKVLPTIKSRTQQYDFHLLAAEELAEHVAWVIHDAQLDLDADVVDHVVRLGAGSARDTLSALDQVAAAGGVFESVESLDDLLDAVARGDAPAALVAVSDAVSAGRDPRVLGEALLGRFRDVFLMRMGGSVDHLPSGEQERVRLWADQLGPRATTRALEAVGDALAEMRNAPDPRIPLEVALVKITRSPDEPDLDALIERIARLEAALAGGGQIAAPAALSTPPGPAAPAAPVAERGDPVDRGAASGSPSRPPAPPMPGRSAPPGGVAAARAALARSTGTETTSSSGPAAAVPPPAERDGVGSGGPSPAGSAAPPAGPSTPDRASSDLRRPADRTAASPTGSGSAPSAPATPDGAGPSDSGAAPRSGPRSAAQTTGRATAESGSADAGTPPATATDSASSGPMSVAQLRELWSSDVLAGLRGVTKAMFSAGRVSDFDGTTVTVSFPNEVHRQKCEQRQGDVEQTLRQRLDSDVRIRLVVDDADDTSPSGPGSDDDFDFGAVDPAELTDAPDTAIGGVDVLTEAFPGAEFVDE